MEYLNDTDVIITTLALIIYISQILLRIIYTLLEFFE